VSALHDVQGHAIEVDAGATGHRQIISFNPSLAPLFISQSNFDQLAACNPPGYNLAMIKSFTHKGLELFFTVGSKSGIAAMHAGRLGLLLALLDQARSVQDMDAPGLRLHPLKGDMEGFWAVTVQANWRLVFRFDGGDAHVVDYLDYH